MAKRKAPSVLRYVVNFLRFHSGKTQKELGRACRIDQAEISRFELGKLVPSEEQLRRMAEVAGIDWSLVAHLREFYTSLLSAIRPEGMSVATLDLNSLEPVLLAVRPYLIDASEPKRPSLEAEQQQADQTWAALMRHPIQFRRRLIEVFPGPLSWALAVRACEASVKSAAHKVEDAVELAELAVSIAGRVAGEESWRSRLLGYCWAHVANARRVANDLPGADQAFAHAWKLWRKGVDSDPCVLEEWLLPAMEASLRRSQRRFHEALELLNHARSSEGGASSNASLTILLNEANIFSRMGEPRRALAALAEAAPLCEASGDRQMLLALRFNMADDLCQLERFEEAAKLLPQVREFALEQSNELDLIRVAWLNARVAAGEGRTAEAIAGLEQVSRDFTFQKLPYNAALSSLDLAVLFLKTGRTSEARVLAIEMAWIFKTKGIDREALLALKLFWDAARQETATVELARKAIAAIRCVV